MFHLIVRSTLEKAHIRVSSPLNYHDGYWVAKVKPPGSPFKATVINDMHIDPYTKKATVYAQTMLFGKVIAPPQVGPGEYAIDKDGNILTITLNQQKSGLWSGITKQEKALLIIKHVSQWVNKITTV